MMTLPMIGLLAGIAVSAQEPAGMPEAWKQKIEAADKALRSGDRARAEAMLVEVVREAEKLGAEDLRLASPLEELGKFYVYRPVKRFAEADPLLRRALAIREKTQGPDHLDLTVTLSWLAVCRMCAGGKDAETAGPLLQRALTIREKKNKDDPEIASTLVTMAEWHMIRKEYDQAESKLMRALAIREKASGPPNADLADVLDDLGNIHMLQSNPYAAKARSKPDPNAPPELQPDRPFPPRLEDIVAPIDGKTKGELMAERHGEQAEQFFRRSLAIREKVLRPDHPDIAATLLKLGQLAELRERPADGVPYLARWLTLEEKAKAPPSKDQAQAGLILAEAALERKDWAEAERRLAKTQGIIEGLPGSKKDEVASILAERADVAVNAGRFDDAETFLRSGLEIEAAVRGSKDPDVVQARDLMAGSYRDHVNDRRAPMLWHRLRILSDKLGHERRLNALHGIIEGYADLLRRTNKAAPPPTREDLEYLSGLCDGLPPDCIEFDARNSIDPVAYKLDDAALAHLGRLYEIERLDLRGPAGGGHRVITDAGLAHIANLINLRYLWIRGNEITDAGLAHLAGLENLEELDVSFNRVGDAGLARLRGLKSLRWLRLSGTDVTDATLEQVVSLKKLELLAVDSTKVTDAGVERLRRARPDLTIEYKPPAAIVPASPAPKLEAPLRAPGKP